MMPLGMLVLGNSLPVGDGGFLLSPFSSREVQSSPQVLLGPPYELRVHTRELHNGDRAVLMIDDIVLGNASLMAAFGAIAHSTLAEGGTETELVQDAQERVHVRPVPEDGEPRFYAIDGPVLVPGMTVTVRVRNPTHFSLLVWVTLWSHRYFDEGESERAARYHLGGPTGSATRCKGPAVNTASGVTAFELDGRWYEVRTLANPPELFRELEKEAK